MPDKMKPHKPAKVKSPILEKMKSSPGGPQTPGEKAKRKKNADSEGHRLTGVNQ